MAKKRTNMMTTDAAVKLIPIPINISDGRLQLGMKLTSSFGGQKKNVDRFIFREFIY